MPPNDSFANASCLPSNVNKKSCEVRSDLLVEGVFVFEVSSLEDDDYKCSQFLGHVDS